MEFSVQSLLRVVAILCAILVPSLVSAEGSGSGAPDDGSGPAAEFATVEVRVVLEERAASGRTIRVSATSGDVTAEQFADSGATVRFEAFVHGPAVIRVEAAGFESVEAVETVDRDRSFVFRLLPSAPVEVSGRVATSSGAAAVATTITLTGVGARGGEFHTTQAALGGEFRFEGVLPGFYDLRADLSGDTVALSNVEFLAATELALGLHPASPRPGIEEHRSACSAAQAGAPALWLVLAAVFRRRRRC